MVTQAVYAVYMESLQTAFMHLQIFLDDKQREQFGMGLPACHVILDDL